MKIDCIVLTKDRPDLMMQLREGLLKQQGVELRVLVLDNGDEPMTSKLVNDWALIYEGGCGQLSAGMLREPRWVLLREKINGFGHGVNMAARALSALPGYESVPLLMLNNDVQLTDPWALHSMAHHLGPAGTKVVGLRLFEDSGLLNHDGVTFQQNQPMHIGRGLPAKDDALCSVTPSVTFACALLDRELFFQLEGLDEGYGWGYEDTDFCLRAAEQGALVVTCRRASAVHNEFGTRPRGGDQQEHLRFYGKWMATGRAQRALSV